MNYYDIQTFLVIAQTRSITKTADSLYLSQPTISHRLKALENELDMKLVSRNKGHKTVELTAKGAEFLPLAERWLELWKETESLTASQDKMYLSIGCIDTLNASVLSPFYRKLLREVPNLYFNVSTHQSYEIYELLEKHEIDAGFVFHNLYFRNIVSTPIMNEKLVLVQSGSGQIQERSIHTNELDPERELYFTWDGNYQIWHDQWISRTKTPRIQVDSFELINSMLEEENYWLIAPETVTEALARRRNVFVSELANETKPPARTTYLVHNRFMSPTLESTLQFFSQELKKYLQEHAFAGTGSEAE
ncbi:MAG: LysR family transcriptional regulator [Lachnospiraceae bacterium]|nr:LysR family transcriptional regulator [Lachnospiraceae bacterium]